MSNTDTLTDLSYLDSNFGSIEETFKTQIHMPKHLRLEIDALIEGYLRNQYGDKFVNHSWWIRTKTWVD
jgi:hypothetical protein